MKYICPVRLNPWLQTTEQVVPNENSFSGHSICPPGIVGIEVRSHDLATKISHKNDCYRLKRRISLGNGYCRLLESYITRDWRLKHACQFNVSKGIENKDKCRPGVAVSICTVLQVSLSIYKPTWFIIRIIK